MLAEAPESQLEPEVGEQINQLLGGTDEELLLGLRDIINDCVHGALASDFVVASLDALIRTLYFNVHGEELTNDWFGEDRG